MRKKIFITSRSFARSYIFSLVNIRRNIAENNQNERAKKFSKLIKLTNITKLAILPKNDLSHLYFIKKILL